MESSGPAGTVSPASASGAHRRARIPRPSPWPCRAVPGLPRHPRPSGSELRRAQCPALTSQGPHDPGSSLQQAERAARRGGVSTKAGRCRSASSLPARGRRGGAWGWAGSSWGGASWCVGGVSEGRGRPAASALEGHVGSVRLSAPLKTTNKLLPSIQIFGSIFSNTRTRTHPRKKNQKQSKKPSLPFSSPCSLWLP